MQPYTLTDKSIELLNRRAIKRFSQAKSKLRQLPFDELNVLETARNLYDDLAADNQDIFLELAGESYQQAEPHGEDEPSAAWLLALLLAYDPVTKYVYQHEVERKRARLAEALISVGKAQRKQNEEWRRALSLWSQQTAQYADIVTDAAVIQAFVDAGISKVRWITQEDEKVCKTCRERNGKVYPITELPEKPHWRCRCYFEAVVDD